MLLYIVTVQWSGSWRWRMTFPWLAEQYNWTNVLCSLSAQFSFALSPLWTDQDPPPAQPHTPWYLSPADITIQAHLLALDQTGFINWALQYRMSDYSTDYPSLALPVTTHRRRSLPKLPVINMTEGCSTF